MGATAALEAAVAVLALRDQVLPPAAAHADDPALGPLDVVRGTARRTPLATVLSTASGFGGHDSALVLRTPA